MSPKRVTVHAAKTQLSRLIQEAAEGKEIIIARRDVPVARLVAIRKKPVSRKFGAMKGRARTTDAFFEPLPESVLEDWEA